MKNQQKNKSESFSNDETKNTNEQSESPVRNTKTVNTSKSIYWKNGSTEAGKLDGRVEGLSVNLHKVYQDYKKEMRDNTAIQDEKKNEYLLKIENIEIEIIQLENNIRENKDEKIPEIKNNIEFIKNEISDARNNPEKISGDEGGKLKYVVSGLLLLGLTIYLFIFYSSASYSAFFKEFGVGDLGIASSIFDAKALPKALADGVTELVLILTIPFVFLGLGFLIHSFLQLSGIKKYVNTAFFLVVTFIFDFILAYEITEKIYNINKDGSFNSDSIPNYDIALAIENVSFWMIIFAGFVVYLIWGYVYGVFSDAFEKRDKVKVFIKEKEKKIEDLLKEQKERVATNENITAEIVEKKKEINNFRAYIDGKIIPMDDIKAHLNDFFLGWLKWMTDFDKPNEEIQQAHLEYDTFVKKKFGKSTQNL